MRFVDFKRFCHSFFFAVCYSSIKTSTSSRVLYCKYKKLTDSRVAVNCNPIACKTWEGCVLLHADPEDAAIIGDNFFSRIWLFIPMNRTFTNPGILFL